MARHVKKVRILRVVCWRIEGLDVTTMPRRRMQCVMLGGR
jgi:hypothetical protein